MQYTNATAWTGTTATSATANFNYVRITFNFPPSGAAGARVPRRPRPSLSPAAYAALGVEETAPPEDVGAAFRRRIRGTHPDMGGSPEEARAVLEAYRHLQSTGQAA